MVGDEDADKDESVDNADDVDARQVKRYLIRIAKAKAQTQSEK